ncbi:MAG: hypothetical protein HYV09_36505 [Deltaproteobacteria bacterium]|nr:hypothetical protein [Deltaproteobacteria bacterium]
MRPNRVFFPQPLLDAWIADERVELHGDELQLRDEGRRYTIAEAVHVLRDAAGGGDRMKLLGKVKTRDQLQELGAEVFEASMIIGDDAYDVVPGFVGEPIGAAAVQSPTANNSEEDLLAQFLIKSL